MMRQLSRCPDTVEAAAAMRANQEEFLTACRRGRITFDEYDFDSGYLFCGDRYEVYVYVDLDGFSCTVRDLRADDEVGEVTRSTAKAAVNLVKKWVAK